MKKFVMALAAVLASSATAGFAGSADVGVLTCRLDGVKNDIVYSKEEFACEFKMTNGNVQTYRGVIKSVGVDLSVTKDLTMVWAVLNPAGNAAAPDELAGNYVGGGASIALAAGAGMNVLVGGGSNSFALQPISVTGLKGAGVNVGIVDFNLR
jgi:Protein of unknown function (DUF992)